MLNALHALNIASCLRCMNENMFLVVLAIYPFLAYLVENVLVSSMASQANPFTQLLTILSPIV